MSEVVHFERRGSVALLTLDRPKRLNAIGSDTVAQLQQHLDVIESDDELRAIVVTGEGRAFSAGADISEFSQLADGHGFAGFVQGLTDAYARLESSPVPSIAAVNGLALGGGFELALACDLRLASPSAQLGVPEIKLGLLPGAGGSQRLGRLLPAGIAKQLLFTGDPLNAEQAFHHGLVNAVHDDVLQAALELAGKLAEGPPLALAAAKRLIDQGRGLPLDSGIVLERETVSRLFDTEDRAEGVGAFQEKRTPKFSGC